MVLLHLGNIELKLDEIAGPALGVELRMRLIGELKREVRDRVAELVDNDYRERKKNNPKARKGLSKYWECELFFLNEAIRDVFKDQLTKGDLEMLKQSTPFRNKILHADFVGLMERMGLFLPGRQFLSSGKRKALTSAEIKESVVSIASGNNDFNQACIHVRQVKGILDDIIKKIEYGS